MKPGNIARRGMIGTWGSSCGASDGPSERPNQVYALGMVAFSVHDLDPRRVVIRWGSKTWPSDPVADAIGLVSELTTAYNRGWLSLTDSGHLAYGKAVMDWFCPLSKDRRATFRAALSDRVPVPLGGPTGIGWDHDVTGEENDEDEIDLFVGVVHPTKPEQVEAINLYWSFGQRDDKEAWTAVTDLAEVLVSHSLPLVLTTQENRWYVELREGLRTWSFGFTEDHKILGGGELTSEMFGLVRWLSSCQGTFKKQFVFSGIQGAPAMPRSLIPATRYDRGDIL